MTKFPELLSATLREAANFTASGATKVTHSAKLGALTQAQEHLQRIRILHTRVRQVDLTKEGIDETSRLLLEARLREQESELLKFQIDLELPLAKSIMQGYWTCLAKAVGEALELLRKTLASLGGPEDPDPDPTSIKNMLLLLLSVTATKRNEYAAAARKAGYKFAQLLGHIRVAALEALLTMEGNRPDEGNDSTTSPRFAQLSLRPDHIRVDLSYMLDGMPDADHISRVVIERSDLAIVSLARATHDRADALCNPFIYFARARLRPKVASLPDIVISTASIAIRNFDDGNMRGMGCISSIASLRIDQPWSHMPIATSCKQGQAAIHTLPALIFEMLPSLAVVALTFPVSLAHGKERKWAADRLIAIPIARSVSYSGREAARLPVIVACRPKCRHVSRQRVRNAPHGLLSWFSAAKQADAASPRVITDIVIDLVRHDWSCVNSGASRFRVNRKTSAGSRISVVTNKHRAAGCLRMRFCSPNSNLKDIARERYLVAANVTHTLAKANAMESANV